MGSPRINFSIRFKHFFYFPVFRERALFHKVNIGPRYHHFMYSINVKKEILKNHILIAWDIREKGSY